MVMIYDEDAGEFALASGRRLRSHGDLLSIDEPDGYVSYGYDGDYLGEPEFTPEERAEIADYMIAKWQAWKEWRPSCHVSSLHNVGLMDAQDDPGMSPEREELARRLAVGMKARREHEQVCIGLRNLGAPVQCPHKESGWA